MWKPFLGSNENKLKPLETKVEYLRRYNPEDLNDLHNKVVELSDLIQYEEYPPAREAMVALMNVYVTAIESVLNITPMTHIDLGGEEEFAKEHFADTIKNKKGNAV